MKIVTSKNRRQPVTRSISTLFKVAVLSLLFTGTAFADVFGRLRFTVTDAATDKPVAGAKITLHDTANVRPDIILETDAGGTVLSPPLEIRAWTITTTVEAHDPDTRNVQVAADTTTDESVPLEPKTAAAINITESVTRVNQRQTGNATIRDQNFIQRNPANAGNPQSLQKVLLTNPGFVQDTVNQAHPRGEHSATKIYIRGFELPGALQGRAGQLLVPEVIQSAEILTGGYAPEYGSETAAILNLDLRSGTTTPTRELMLDGGTYSTADGSFTIGGQLGSPIGAPDAQGRVARSFGYLINLNGRTTANALEPPQPDNQTAHNKQVSQAYFGNFDYSPGSRDHITLTFNDAPANTDIANRTGLPAQFASVGQGYGFGGARNADGTVPGGDATALGGGTLPLPSQQAAGQDIRQNDNNRFEILNYRHSFSSQLTGLLSIGNTRSGLEIHNRNPAINLLALPVDNSIEFNPDLVRNANDNEIEGNLTLSQGRHTYKGGFVLDQQSGDESYQFIPGSQLALDDLAANAPILAPAGTGSVQLDAAGKPVLDATGNPVPVTDVLGNQVYTIDPKNPTAPVVKVHRSGYYRVAYLQDTWNLTRRFTANYGFRLDSYHQSENLGKPPVDKTEVSPRVNLSYALTPLTIGRASYNHLFIQPPLAQGAILGQPIVPETLDQYEASLERQVAPRQVVKVAYYYKDIRNQVDTGLLIPFTQVGAYTSVTFQRGAVHGAEFSYDLYPRNNVGLGAYLAYTYSIAQPNGLDNTGGQVPTFNDHDQRHTLSTGLDYTLRSGATAAVNVYYGSGVASSVISGIINNTAGLNNGARTPRTTVNLRIGTPTLFGLGVLQLNIENLLDERNVINFNSGFSGTRFEQGRRILLSAKARF